MKFLAFFVLFGALSAQAALLSPSSIEVKFSYTAEFQTTDSSDVETLIGLHSQHLFGYLQAPAMVRRYRVNDQTLGIGAPRLPLTYEVLKIKKMGALKTISYKVVGLLLLNKKVAREVLRTGTWQITLPMDLDNFYAEKCTDDHYSDLSDFWYFYDPFRTGCEYLREPPMAAPVLIKISPLKTPDSDPSAGLHRLRGNNGNGNLFQITTINGFSEDARNRYDEGRQSFELINNWLRKQGFEETLIARYMNRPIHQFDKTLSRHDGSTINIRVTRLLAETSVLSKNVTFAKFFKEAVKSADVIIYAGHSGLGGNLDIESLEEKAGPLEFNSAKRQLFFFDGCSTYSYYLSMFEAKKNKGKIDILTNGLASYFEYEPLTHEALLKNLLSIDVDPTWNDILKDMEKPLEGMTYMLNVGSL